MSPVFFETVSVSGIFVGTQVDRSLKATYSDLRPSAGGLFAKAFSRASATYSINISINMLLYS